MHFLTKRCQTGKKLAQLNLGRSNAAVSKQLVSSNCSRRDELPAWVGLHQNGLLPLSVVPCAPLQQTHLRAWQAHSSLVAASISLHFGSPYSAWAVLLRALGPAEQAGESTCPLLLKRCQSGGLHCWLLEVPFGERWHRESSRHESVV